MQALLNKDKKNCLVEADKLDSFLTNIRTFVEKKNAEYLEGNAKQSIALIGAVQEFRDELYGFIENQINSVLLSFNHWNLVGQGGTVSALKPSQSRLGMPAPVAVQELGDDILLDRKTWETFLEKYKSAKAGEGVGM